MRRTISQNIATDAFWYRGHSGISRFGNEVRRRLKPNCLFTFEAEIMGKPLWAARPLLVAAALRRVEADVFWSPGFVPAWYSVCPQVVTVHDLNHLYCYPAAHRLYARYLLGTLWRKCAAIVTVSEFSKRRLINKIGIEASRVHVAYNGVSESFSPASDTVVGGYMLYVGNHRSYKNVPRLIRAYASTLDKCDWNLVLVGERSFEAVRLVEDLGIKSRVQFVPSCGEMELADWYRGAIAVSFISLHEGFGLPPVEALSCGTPVVVGRCSVMPEICGNYVRYVNPLDVGDIASGMLDLFKNNSYWRAVAKSARDWLRRYSWDSCAAVVGSVISKVNSQPKEVC